MQTGTGLHVLLCERKPVFITVDRFVLCTVITVRLTQRFKEEREQNIKDKDDEPETALYQIIVNTALTPIL